MVMALLAAHRILQAADRVLHPAGSLVGLAVGLEFLVAEDPPGGFFHGPLGLLCGAFDSIFIHCVKSHPTLTPGFASNDDPSDGAETGVAELHIAEQSRSWRAAIGERKIMRGS